MLRSALLILALLGSFVFSAIAHAEVIVVSFTDSEHCPFCKRLDATWSDPQVQQDLKGLPRRRLIVEVNQTSPEALATWGVSDWPQTWLVDADEKGGIRRVIRRKAGAMTVNELRTFIRE